MGGVAIVVVEHLRFGGCGIEWRGRCDTGYGLPYLSPVQNFDIDRERRG